MAARLCAHLDADQTQQLLPALGKALLQHCLQRPLVIGRHRCRQGSQERPGLLPTGCGAAGCSEGPLSGHQQQNGSGQRTEGNTEAVPASAESGMQIA